MLFITLRRNCSLSSLSLLTKEEYTYKAGESSLGDIWKLALDSDNQQIYASARLTNTDRNCLVRLDYADTELTIVYQGPEISYTFALDVFMDSVYWGYQDSLYMCKLTPICQKWDVKLLHRAPVSTY